MGTLEGRAAMVTGGASGIGRASARALAREGARVLVADIAVGRGEAVVTEIRAEGGQAEFRSCDVTQSDDVEAAVEACEAAFGGLDVLHNNAAYLLGEGDGGITELTLEGWERAFAVNTRGVMLGCKYAVPAMRRRGGGAIVNTSSGSALQGDVTLTAYGASKGAVNTLTRYVATQHGKEGIRCNAIAPGLIKTEGVRYGMPPERIARIEAHTLTPRSGEPEDIAEMVVFLGSDAGSFVTGQVISVDGGIGSHMPTYADAPVGT